MKKQLKNKNRPYCSYKIDDLIKVFENNKENCQELSALIEELSYRSMPRAKMLEKKILTILEKKKTLTQSEPVALSIDEDGTTIEKSVMIQRTIKEIEQLEECIRVEKLKKGHDKVTWFFGILGFIFPICLTQVYDDISSGRSDGVTQIYFILGLSGICMLLYALFRERREDAYIQQLEKEVAQRQRELQIFTTGKLY